MLKSPCLTESLESPARAADVTTLRTVLPSHRFYWSRRDHGFFRAEKRIPERYEAQCRQFERHATASPSEH